MLNKAYHFYNQHFFCFKFTFRFRISPFSLKNEQKQKYEIVSHFLNCSRKQAAKYCVLTFIESLLLACDRCLSNASLKFVLVN